VTTLPKTALNSGEITPRLFGRVDLERYLSALETCLNAIPLSHGPVIRRPGFEYIASCKATTETELIPFEFSITQAYMIEAGAYYFRFYMDGGQIQGADSYTKLLLNFEGYKGTITFTDEGTGHTLTANGGAIIDTVQYKFGESSGKFDGTGDYLSIPDHADFDFDSGAFVIETWVRFNAVTNQQCFYSQATGTDYIALIQDFNEDKLYFAVMLSSRLILQSAAWSPSVDTWYHVAIIRGWGGNANDYAFTVGGVVIGTFTDADDMPNLAASAYIGSMPLTTVIDFGDTGHAVTFVGTATLSTAQKKWGNGSLLLDGDSDNLTVPDHADWDIQTNFTIDLWVKHTDHAGIEDYVNQREDTTNFWTLRHTHGEGLAFYIQSAGSNIVVCGPAGEITDNDWHHIALCKVGNEYGIYKDGVQVSHTSDSSMDTFTGLLRIGLLQTYFDGHMDEIRITHANSFSAAPVVGLTDTIIVPTAPHVSDSDTKLLLHCDTKDFNGWLDGFRISKGVARWTADFSANLPTVPYPSYQSGGGGTVYELATPYKTTDLHDIQWVQSADTLYLVHPNYSPRKLTRTGHAAWTLTVISFTAMPSHWGIQSKAITGITQANPGVVTCVAHGLDDGDVVLITNVAGMVEVNGNLYTVANKAADTFELSGVNTTAYTAYVSGGWWNEYNKNPSTVNFYEERLLFASAPDLPQTIDGSKAGDFEDMTTGVDDADGFQFTIASGLVNVIRWLAAARKLLMGTIGGEWWMSGGGADDALTPTNVKVRQDSALGSANVRSIQVGNKHLFLQRPGRTIRALGYVFEDDAYAGTDLSILAEHLTADYNIIRMDLQKVPDQALWCIRSDGVLLGMTFLPEHEVIGWHRHTTGASGLFKSVAVIPGDDDCEVWVIVQRTVGGSTVQYIERMKKQETSATASDYFHVDSGLTYNGSPVTTISGLVHLEGVTVAIWADGAAVANQAVSGGTITLTTAASIVHIGIPYNTDIKTLKLDPGDASFQGKIKRIHKLILRLYQTMGFTYGRNASNLDTVTHAELTTEDKEVLFQDIYDSDGQIFIRKSDAGPLTIISIIPIFEAYDR